MMVTYRVGQCKCILAPAQCQYLYLVAKWTIQFFISGNGGTQMVVCTIAAITITLLFSLYLLFKKFMMLFSHGVAMILFEDYSVLDR